MNTKPSPEDRKDERCWYVVWQPNNRSTECYGPVTLAEANTVAAGKAVEFHRNAWVTMAYSFHKTL